MRANIRVSKPPNRRSFATETTRWADHHQPEQLLLRLQRQIGNQAVGRLLHQPGGLTVIQRLSLYNTDWSKATRVRRSGSGQTGVLFVEDGTSDALVVKPGSKREPALETQVAHTVHQKLSKKAAKVPPIRLATTLDRDHLRATVWFKLTASDDQLRETGGDLDAYKQLIMSQFVDKPEVVFIMGKASGQEFEEIAKKQRPVAKELLQTPDYVERLGFVTAVDLFLGNTDRLFYGNLGNWMVNVFRYEETIWLIDNVDPAGFAAQKFNKESQADWITALKPKLEDLNKTADEVTKNLAGSLKKINFQLTDAQKEKFKTHFLQGLHKGRERILSKLAPRIGRRSRSLKKQIKQFEGGGDAWRFLKQRAAVLRGAR